MKLQNDIELANTQRKLAGLEKLILKREQSSDDSPVHEMSLESMRRFAKKLQEEINEYIRAHQIA